MNSDPFYSFVFKGLLTEESLDKTLRIKKNKFGDNDFQKIVDSLGINELNEELVLKAKKMAIVYTAICAFENTVREFVSKKLLENKGENWWEISVSIKIRKKAESRKEEESKMAYTSRRNNNLLYRIWRFTQYN